MVLIVPVIQLLIIPLAADFEIKNINISIVDNDRSPYSMKLSEKIMASGYFKLVSFGNSFNKSFKEFEDDRADIILEIPHDFESGLVRENEGSLYIAVNAINGVKATLGSVYLGSIISDFNSGIRAEWIQPVKQPPLPVVEVVPLNMFNPHLRYTSFMVPGILVVMVTMVGVYLCSMNIVKEKETGTIEQINVTPIRKYQFILGKLIPFWLIGMFVFSVGLFGVAKFAYAIDVRGSVLTLYLFLSAYLTAIMGIGLIISNYSATQQQAMSLAFFFMMVFLLMSGLFTPLDNMPEWAKWIARLTPVTYFIEVIRLIVLKGSGIRDILPQFGIMCAMAVAFNAWAVFNYKKTN